MAKRQMNLQEFGKLIKDLKSREYWESKANNEDEIVIVNSICSGCDEKNMKSVALRAPFSYRVFAVCQNCGLVTEI